MSQTFNQVTLRGRISAEPESRELPSGDEIVSFRLVVPRSSRVRRRSRQSVDVIECTAWTKAVQRSLLRMSAGDAVGVTGELRRQFSRRGGSGVASFVSVDVLSVERVPVASST